MSAGHRRAQVAVTHPHSLCRFNSCPTHCTNGLVAQLAEQDSLKVEVQGSTPCGATGRLMGVSSNGKTVGLHPADEGSTPSTVHCNCPGGERDIMAPSEGAGPGSTPGRGTVLASMVKGTSRGSAKAEFLVRLQVGALWPNSKRQRDPAVNRGCAGSTPAGHPLVLVPHDGTSTPPIRVPPLVAL